MAKYDSEKDFTEWCREHDAEISALIESGADPAGLNALTHNAFVLGQNYILDHLKECKEEK